MSRTMSGTGAAETARSLADTFRGGIDVAEATCSVDDCTKPVLCRGWCSMHYQRWLLRGRLNRLTTEDRFWAKVDITPGCWLWVGASFAATKTGPGYGNFQGNCAHRWSYEHHIGPIPEGLTIDHLCRVRNCVNPMHLRLLTNLENARDNGNLGKTHCKRGHPFDEVNTLVKATGARACRACHRERTRAGKARYAIVPFEDFANQAQDDLEAS